VLTGKSVPSFRREIDVVLTHMARFTVEQIRQMASTVSEQKLVEAVSKVHLNYLRKK